MVTIQQLLEDGASGFLESEKPLHQQMMLNSYKK